MNANDIIKRLKKIGNKERAKHSQRFFKTGPGEYGEGDVFLGLSMPEQRHLAKQYEDAPAETIQELLESKYHESRLVGLIIMVKKYEKAKDKKEKNKIAKFYLKNKKYINNWDLVDVTCPRILGSWLLNKDRAILYKLAKSKALWDRRIAVLATFAFIAKNNFADSIKLAEILLTDKEDLMHKAVGWMLREVGKRDLPTLLTFLDKHTTAMPRTMLRYAIEKLPEKQRQYYLNKK